MNAELRWLVRPDGAVLCFYLQAGGTCLGVTRRCLQQMRSVWRVPEPGCGRKGQRNNPAAGHGRADAVVCDDDRRSRVGTIGRIQVAEAVYAAFLGIYGEWLQRDFG